MTLHLTPAEAEQLAAAGSGVLFRAGVPSHVINRIGPDFGKWKHNPPAEFVEAAAACETCGGQLLTDDAGDPTCWACSGEACFHTHPIDEICDHDVEERHAGERCRDICPDCLDGKRRVAVVVPCDGKCNGCGVVADWEGSAIECPRCDGYGAVTVGHIVVTWGPLVVVGYRRTLNQADEVQLTDGTWIAPPLGVNPASLIGQYAIGVEVVS